MAAPTSPVDSARHAQDFRQDIHGLRALAVVLVVAFHAFPDRVPGGFVGVDIFFLISGYLIGGIVLRGLAAGTFDMAAFYRRRATRILPALLVVLAATCAFGWISLYSFEFQALCEQVAGAIGFVSNLILWNQAGYFDATAAQKPLMHLWSLAVEEQFYLLFPLAMWVGCKRRWPPGRVVLAMLLLSLAVGLVQTREDVVGAFFDPLARVWEILAGALLAAREIARRRDPGAAARRANLLATAGLVLIAVATSTYSDTLAFPGAYALLPVLGAVLLIAAGPANTIARHLLSNPLAKWLGSISYPLYLWHWPILSFAAILQPDGQDFTIRMVALAAALALASLTCVFVERPVAAMQARRWRLSLLALPAAAIGLFGATGGLAAGFPMRAVSVTAMSAMPYAVRGTYAAGNVQAGCGVPQSRQSDYAFCQHDSRTPVRFALIGDSKATALAPGLFSTIPRAGFWMFVGGYRPQGTPVPVLSDRPEFRSHQATLRPALAAIAADDRIRVVVIATATRSLFNLQRADSLAELADTPEYPAALEGLTRTVGLLAKAGKKVVLLVDNPTFRDPMLCVSRTTSVAWIDSVLDLRAGVSTCEIARAAHLRQSARYRQLLAAVVDRFPGQAFVFDTLDVLCDPVLATCSAMDGEHHLYSFTDHISTFAANRIAAKLVPFVESLGDPGRDGR